MVELTNFVCVHCCHFLASYPRQNLAIRWLAFYSSSLATTSVSHTESLQSLCSASVGERVNRTGLANCTSQSYRIMTSCSLLFIVVLVAAVTLYTDAFSPIISHTQQRSQSSLSMGIFDSISKAFSNEEYGDPPEAVKAVARHILVPTLDDANMVLTEFGKGESSFDSLAGKYSTCPSKSRGGSLGSFGPGTSRSCFVYVHMM